MATDGWTVDRPDLPIFAPDGSEIRPLAHTSRTSLAHCSLPPGAVSLAVRHKTIEEVWYFLSGQGEVWRKIGGREEITSVAGGRSLTIPINTHFQFRNTGTDPLEFILATTPPWPGDAEAVRVTDFWPTA